jgi:zinc transporter ZupT
MYYGAFKGPWGISGGNVYAYYMFLIVGLLSLLGSFSVSWILAKKEGVKRMKLFYVLVTSFSISYVGCMTYYISVANNSELYAIPFILFLLFFIGGGILYLIGKSLITHNTTSSKK